ncbi:MAG: 3-isopropylmalate dehydratase large subunit [Gemmatimonadetes bacterium]|nr:3-isopropylmalate dehydratase large subunit [Gemmatimonadota bacterium]
MSGRNGGSAKTLVAKIWEKNLVRAGDGEPDLMYVDLHLVHEVTSPQAFEGLALSGRRVRRPDLTFATVDHNVPTTDRSLPILDQLSKRQLEVMRENAERFGVRLLDIHDPRQGIVHVIGPELGLTRPGMIIVCGDSHTSTHGAFGALAFGIGTSEVEHVLATQCIQQRRPRSMELRLEGTPPEGVTAKDLILAVIGQIGVSGGGGHVVEYTGEAIRALSMEERMTVCNMSIEAGARAGMISPDETTFAYMRGRELGPSDAELAKLVVEWKGLATEPGATFDKTVKIDVSTLEPQVTWGTTPGMVVPISATVPTPESFPDAAGREGAQRALAYMGLEAGVPIESIRIDRVFIGSCTNGRIGDLREAARIVEGRRVAKGVHAMVVPGSATVKRQAEAEGLDRVFKAAGFEWREAGCSMCLGMNPDILQPGERCASTSNRNFEGRQGRGGRTHLVSPAMAAAAAVAGHFTDPRALEN